jgi:hypothetical protein
MSSLITAVAMVIAALTGADSLKASRVAEYYVETSGLTRVDLPLLIAKDYHESSLRSDAVSPVGAIGRAQLHGFYRDWWRRDCRDAINMGFGEEVCEAINVRIGGFALRDHMQRCGGGWLRGISSYRGSGCNPTGKALFKAQQTLKLARMVRHRLAHPSTKRMVAPRLAR